MTTTALIPVRYAKCADCPTLIPTRQRNMTKVLCPECEAERKRIRDRKRAPRLERVITLETGGVRVEYDPDGCGGYPKGAMFGHYYHEVNLSNCAYSQGTLLRTRHGLYRVVTVRNKFGQHQTCVKVGE